MKVQLVVLVFIFVVVSGAENVSNKTELEVQKGREFFGNIIETGRTLVHNTLKRFMIILPAIFFKLGIAFTMLLLVTFVSVNNGFIGFLLLVVGLSSVLARFQEARRAPVVPYVNQVPVYQTKYVQDWDRKDRGLEGSMLYGQQYPYAQIGGYYKQG